MRNCPGWSYAVGDGPVGRCPDTKWNILLMFIV